MLTRRQALQIGTLSAVGLTLPQLLHGESEAAQPKSPSAGNIRRPAKSCILFFMEGGPSHIDLWDMKPDAPAEIRGIYKPIGTSLPGFHICEKLPHWSPVMHRMAVVRSVTHKFVDHNASSYYTLTGQYPIRGSKLIRGPSPENAPPFGAVLAKLRSTGQALPDFVHLPRRMFNCGSFIPGQLAGFLGDQYDPFIAGDASVQNYQVPGLARLPQLSQQRMDRRHSLLEDLRHLRPHDVNRASSRMDTFYEKAFSLVNSPRARKAFKLSEEPDALRRRYGLPPSAKEDKSGRGTLSHLGQSMLLARRLVEAGVRLVTVWAGGQAFDTHRNQFPTLNKQLCPYLDLALPALIEDLADRGMLDETLVVVLGEFGRTPKLGQITSSAGASPEGRDHWPNCYTAFFAGGPIKPGIIYGASDRIAAYPTDNPVSPMDIAATIYTAMGIDPHTRIYDAFNRPHTLADGEPISALL